MAIRVLHAALLAAITGPWVAGCATSGTPAVSAPGTLLAAAIDDAARRSGVARSDIEVMSAEAVTWPDGSLGCPEPGMMYTQALIPGYRIVLRAGTDTFNYHARAPGPPVFCPADRILTPVPAADDPSV